MTDPIREEIARVVRIVLIDAMCAPLHPEKRGLVSDVIADDLLPLIARIREEEREACARIAERCDTSSPLSPSPVFAMASLKAREIAAAIRGGKADE